VKVHRCLIFGFFLCMFFLVIFCYLHVSIVVKRRVQRHKENAMKRKHLMQIPAFLQAISNVDDEAAAIKAQRSKRKFSLFSLGGSRRLSAISPWIKARLSLPSENVSSGMGLPLKKMEPESKESLAESKKKLDKVLQRKSKSMEINPKDNKEGSSHEAIKGRAMGYNYQLIKQRTEAESSSELESNTQQKKMKDSVSKSTSILTADQNDSVANVIVDCVKKHSDPMACKSHHNISDLKEPGASSKLSTTKVQQYDQLATIPIIIHSEDGSYNATDTSSHAAANKSALKTCVCQKFSGDRQYVSLPQNISKRVIEESHKHSTELSRLRNQNAKSKTKSNERSVLSLEKRAGRLQKSHHADETRKCKATSRAHELRRKSENLSTCHRSQFRCGFCQAGSSRIKPFKSLTHLHNTHQLACSNCVSEERIAPKMRSDFDLLKLFNKIPEESDSESARLEHVKKLDTLHMTSEESIDPLDFKANDISPESTFKFCRCCMILSNRCQPKRNSVNKITEYRLSQNRYYDLAISNLDQACGVSSNQNYTKDDADDGIEDVTSCTTALLSESYDKLKLCEDLARRKSRGNLKTFKSRRDEIRVIGDEIDAADDVTESLLDHHHQISPSASIAQGHDHFQRPVNVNQTCCVLSTARGDAHVTNSVIRKGRRRLSHQASFDDTTIFAEYAAEEKLRSDLKSSDISTSQAVCTERSSREHARDDLHSETMGLNFHESFGSADIGIEGTECSVLKAVQTENGKNVKPPTEGGDRQRLKTKPDATHKKDSFHADKAVVSSPQGRPLTSAVTYERHGDKHCPYCEMSKGDNCLGEMETALNDPAGEFSPFTGSQSQSESKYRGDVTECLRNSTQTCGLCGVSDRSSDSTSANHCLKESFDLISRANTCQASTMPGREMDKLLNGTHAATHKPHLSPRAHDTPTHTPNQRAREITPSPLRQQKLKSKDCLCHQLEGRFTKFEGNVRFPSLSDANVGCVFNPTPSRPTNQSNDRREHKMFDADKESIISGLSHNDTKPGSLYGNGKLDTRQLLESDTTGECDLVSSRASGTNVSLLSPSVTLAQSIASPSSGAVMEGAAVNQRFIESSMVQGKFISVSPSGFDSDRRLEKPSHGSDPVFSCDGHNVFSSHRFVGPDTPLTSCECVIQNLKLSPESTQGCYDGVPPLDVIGGIDVREFDVDVNQFYNDRGGEWHSQQDSFIECADKHLESNQRPWCAMSGEDNADSIISNTNNGSCPICIKPNLQLSSSMVISDVRSCDLCLLSSLRGVCSALSLARCAQTLRHKGRVDSISNITFLVVAPLITHGSKHETFPGSILKPHNHQRSSTSPPYDTPLPLISTCIGSLQNVSESPCLASSVFPTTPLLCNGLPHSPVTYYHQFDSKKQRCHTCGLKVFHPSLELDQFKLKFSGNPDFSENTCIGGRFSNNHSVLADDTNILYANFGDVSFWNEFHLFHFKNILHLEDLFIIMGSLSEDICSISALLRWYTITETSLPFMVMPFVSQYFEWTLLGHLDLYCSVMNMCQVLLQCPNTSVSDTLRYDTFLKNFCFYHMLDHPGIDVQLNSSPCLPGSVSPMSTPVNPSCLEAKTDNNCVVIASVVCTVCLNCLHAQTSLSDRDTHFDLTETCVEVNSLPNEGTSSVSNNEERHIDVSLISTETQNTALNSSKDSNRVLPDNANTASNARHYECSDQRTEITPGVDNNDSRRRMSFSDNIPVFVNVASLQGEGHGCVILERCGENRPTQITVNDTPPTSRSEKHQQYEFCCPNKTAKGLKQDKESIPRLTETKQGKDNSNSVIKTFAQLLPTILLSPDTPDISKNRKSITSILNQSEYGYLRHFNEVSLNISEEMSPNSRSQEETLPYPSDEGTKTVPETWRKQPIENVSGVTSLNGSVVLDGVGETERDTDPAQQDLFNRCKEIDSPSCSVTRSLMDGTLSTLIPLATHITSTLASDRCEPNISMTLKSNNTDSSLAGSHTLKNKSRSFSPLTLPQTATGAIHSTLLACLPTYGASQDVRKEIGSNNKTYEFFVRSVFDAFFDSTGVCSTSEPCLTAVPGEDEEIYEFPLFPLSSGNIHSKGTSNDRSFYNIPSQSQNLFMSGSRSPNRSCSRGSGMSHSWYSLNDLDPNPRPTSLRKSRFMYLASIRRQLNHVFSPKSLRQFFGINGDGSALKKSGTKVTPRDRLSTNHINVIITRCESLVMDKHQTDELPPMRGRAVTLDPAYMDKGGARVSTESAHNCVMSSSADQVITPKPRASSLDTTHSSVSPDDQSRSPDTSIDRSRGCSLDLLSPASASVRTGSMCSDMSSISRLTECSAYTETSRS
ncbi:hypothetical protein Bpfe_011852, partial [Biomphalaria pfeifferi]